MNSIPSVNLEDFLSGDLERKQKFVDEIGKAYEEIGFVALKGHFLSDNLVKDLYTEIKNFFDLPLETKAKYEIKGLDGQRGYTSFGKKHAKGRKEGDLSDTKLDVLDNCIDDKNPKQFKDITAGEFLNQRLFELGLVKK